MPRPRPLSRFATALLLIATTFTACADTPPVDDGSDWPHYARDLAATKYSPLEQISTANVAQLEVAWSWESADYRLSGEHEGASVNPNYQA
ncbi:MAG: membrane-bound PQQ-dependent dehydrogenase, glucose/quinate/shikimate family, partial [Longimicrobiales bacterium]